MLVILHGGPGGDYRVMLNCKKFTEDGFYVVFYDQRGSGLSRRHNKDVYTGQFYIDDLEGVINHYRSTQGQKIFLLGQSWGAMLATAYINAHPSAISGAVLSEPGGFTWDDTKGYISRWMKLSMFDETSNDFLSIDEFLTADDHVKIDYRGALRSAGGFAPGNKLGITGPMPLWRQGAVCNAAMTSYAETHPFDFTQNLKQYTTKILFAYSELNQAYGKEYAEKVSSAYPNVQLVEVKGTGHEIPYSGWENYYPVAKTYLNVIK
jgi:proline iminopeptidase